MPAKCKDGRNRARDWKANLRSGLKAIDRVTAAGREHRVTMSPVGGRWLVAALVLVATWMAACEDRFERPSQSNDDIDVDGG